ncbi:hypothetical protein DFH08DRAFT_883720 [Mycena albidolilacea]|uniref:Uncharacterized protein n=1 Tax=Mycena albidolilacea TaxID=1033008 RepID=A0AAD7EK27_9AGAR|nr:hypothetical protein DFH08DRAFT_883720 [Mycena albidolilacea]
MNPGRGRGGGPAVDLVRDLLRKAQEEGASGGETTTTRSGFFNDGGHTLGGEGSPSAYVAEAREEVEGAPVASELMLIMAVCGTQTNSPSAYYSPSDATVAHVLRRCRQRIVDALAASTYWVRSRHPSVPACLRLPPATFLLPPFPPPSPLLSLSTHVPRASGFSSIGLYCIISRTNTILFICRRQRVAGREEAGCQYKHERGSGLGVIASEVQTRHALKQTRRS